VFRRDTASLLAFAVSFFPHEFGGRSGDTLVGALIFSPSPDSMRLARKGTVVGYTATFRELVASQPQMVGLELFHEPSRTIARTRFGIRPAPTLSAMTERDQAISDIALIIADTSGAELSNNPEMVLRRMHATTAFGEIRRFGIYWETYGVNPADTVETSIAVTQLDQKEGVLKRVAVRIGLADRKEGSVTSRWRGTLGAQAWLQAGRIPIAGQQLVLGTDRLEPGRYSVKVTVSRPGAAPLIATRFFTIVAPAASTSR
jgi:hypothetical protein